MMEALLLGPIAAAGFSRLRGRLGDSCRFTVLMDPDEAGSCPEAVEAAEVIVGWPVPPGILARARRLRLIHVPGAGVDGADLDALPPQVMVANTHHHEAAIAEYVMLAMLWFARRPDIQDRRMREGYWDASCIWGQEPVFTELSGRNLLLAGLGRIAREVALRARAFSLRISGLTRDPLRAGLPVDEALPWSHLNSALAAADYVVLCCPLTQETRGLIARPQLERMKPSAVLINPSRAHLVDEQALFEALRDGRIGGAALDVWYSYPHRRGQMHSPSRFPFHQLPNVLMTPHSSGWTRHTLDRRMEEIAANIIRLAAGQPLINRIR